MARQEIDVNKRISKNEKPSLSFLCFPTKFSSIFPQKWNFVERERSALLSRFSGLHKITFHYLITTCSATYGWITPSAAFKSPPPFSPQPRFSSYENFSSRFSPPSCFPFGWMSGFFHPTVNLGLWSFLEGEGGALQGSERRKKKEGPFVLFFFFFFRAPVGGIMA